MVDDMHSKKHRRSYQEGGLLDQLGQSSRTLTLGQRTKDKVARDLLRDKAELPPPMSGPGDVRPRREWPQYETPDRGMPYMGTADRPFLSALRQEIGREGRFSLSKFLKARAERRGMQQAAGPMTLEGYRGEDWATREDDPRWYRDIVHDSITGRASGGIIGLQNGGRIPGYFFGGLQQAGGGGGWGGNIKKIAAPVGGQVGVGAGIGGALGGWQQQGGGMGGGGWQGGGGQQGGGMGGGMQQFGPGTFAGAAGGGSRSDPFLNNPQGFAQFRWLAGTAAGSPWLAGWATAGWSAATRCPACTRRTGHWSRLSGAGTAGKLWRTSTVRRIWWPRRTTISPRVCVPRGRAAIRGPHSGHYAGGYETL